MIATGNGSGIRWMCTVAMCLVSLQSTGAQGEEHPRLWELLKKYAQTQDSFKSFIYKADLFQKSNLSFKNWMGRGKGLKGTFTRYQDVEYRYDGDRFRDIHKKWGDLNTYLNRPRAEARRVSFLWDGNFFVTSFGHRAKIMTNKKEAKLVADRMVKTSFGWMNGSISGTGQRVDAFLTKHARKAVVRKEPEIINGAKCYLVEAKTPEGDIKVWFDSLHGFNVAQMEFRRTPKHKVEPVGTLSIVVTIDKFMQINGVWIPIEGQKKAHGQQLNGDHFSRLVTTKRRDILLNPDHDALGSFLIDDIEEGARVSWREGFVPVSVRDTWKDGNVVDKNGRVVLEVSRDRAPSPKAKPPKIDKE